MTHHLTFRLWDALPQAVLAQWEEELGQLPLSEGDRERRIRSDAYLDQGHGSCYLRSPEIATLVENALLHFDGARYRLHAWCVMPNHVHVLNTASEGHTHGAIAHSWKSFTANQANRLLERQGTFWQRDHYDRYIRNARHFQSAVEYIENNPVKAGLCEKSVDWLWSSARSR